MTDSPDLTPAKRQQHAERNTRLARALRENLHRRKQQARAKQQPPSEPAAGRRDNDPAA
ncbi:MAG TPA: hypothetical protein VGN21_12380 [Stellaceae bacterium]